MPAHLHNRPGKQGRELAEGDGGGRGRGRGSLPAQHGVQGCGHQGGASHSGHHLVHGQTGLKASHHGLGSSQVRCTGVQSLLHGRAWQGKARHWCDMAHPQDTNASLSHKRVHFVQHGAMKVAFRWLGTDTSRSCRLPPSELHQPFPPSLTTEFFHKTTNCRARGRGHTHLTMVSHLAQIEGWGRGGGHSHTHSWQQHHSGTKCSHHAVEYSL